MDVRIDIPAGAALIIDALESAGYEAYVVGGCVRDALLGREPNDWDIATSARPEQTKAVMGACGLHCVDTGIRYGTVTALVGEGDCDPSNPTAYETTTFRCDGAYSDGRHPDSVDLLDSIEGDLSRRDFTVNAMAYNPRCGLVDLFDGRSDLAAGVLRSVGDAHVRFAEDALRIMRGIRFSACLGFAIAPETARAIHEDCALLERVSAERIYAELAKLVTAPAMINCMLEFSDVISTVVPEIAPCIGFDQHSTFHCYTVWEHCVRAAEAAPADDLALRFAMLFHDIGKPSTFFMGEDGHGHFYGHRIAGADLFAQIARRLKMPRALAAEVEVLVRYHDAEIPTTKKGMRRWAIQFGPDTVRRLFQVHRFDISALDPWCIQQGLADVDAAEELFAEAIAEVEVFGLSDLCIDGRDLLDIGFVQGPSVGKALSKLLEAVVDADVANDRDALLARARELAETM